jgi:hypothetical protein
MVGLPPEGAAKEDAMERLRWLVVAFLATLLCLPAGCGSDEGDDGDTTPSNEAAAKAQALTGPVKSSLDKPTGTVNAEAVKFIFSAQEGSAAAGKAGGFVPGVPTGSTPADATPGSGCVNAGATGGSIDFAVCTDGQITGKATYQTAVAGTNVFFYVQYDNVCSAGEGWCINGEYAIEVAGQQPNYTMTVAMKMTVTEGGKSTSLSAGYRMTVSDNGQKTTIEWVYTDSAGNSYVVTGSFTATMGQITVRGNNGEWTCSYSVANDTYAGSCTGTGGSFDF